MTEHEAAHYRRIMADIASVDTAYDGMEWEEGTLNGHCGPASFVILRRFGGSIRTARVQGHQHLFNRLDDGQEVDLTSEQYGGDGFHPITTKSRAWKLPELFSPRWERFLRRFERAWVPYRPPSPVRDAWIPRMPRIVMPTYRSIQRTPPWPVSINDIEEENRILRELQTPISENPTAYRIASDPLMGNIPAVTYSFEIVDDADFPEEARRNED